MELDKRVKLKMTISQRSFVFKILSWGECGSWKKFFREGIEGAQILWKVFFGIGGQLYDSPDIESQWLIICYWQSVY